MCKYWRFFGVLTLVLLFIPANSQTSSAAPVTGKTDRDDNPKPQKVEVISIPPISSEKPYGGIVGYFYDWGPWAFTALLVVVGGLQVRTMFGQSQVL
jgi:hypothetical protein